MNEERLFELCEGYRSDMIRDLSSLVAIPSVSENIPETKRALSFMLDTAKGMGFNTESYCDNSVGMIEYGEGDETVGILAHVDVVPAFEQPGWKTDPFELVLRDGVMYGRGVLDDKGPAVTALYAMKALKDAGISMNKRIRLILGTQEEVEWTDFLRFRTEYAERLDEFMPDYGFTPDSGFPICNVGKGCIDLDLIFEFGENGGADPEKDGWRIASVNAGLMMNSVPEKAEARLIYSEKGVCISEKLFDAEGKSVHSSRPEQGINAIFGLVEKLKAFSEAEGDKALSLKASGLYRQLISLNEFFSEPFGSSLGLASESEYYNGEFVHKNCFSPTMIRQKDGKTVIHINLRPAYGYDADKIVKRFEEIAEAAGGRIEVGEYLPAIYVDSERPWIKELAKAYEEVSGLKNEFVLDYGASYAQAMPNTVVWGPVFPGHPDTYHLPNEEYSLGDMMLSLKITALALARIAENAEPLK